MAASPRRCRMRGSRFRKRSLSARHSGTLAPLRCHHHAKAGHSSTPRPIRCKHCRVMDTGSPPRGRMTTELETRVRIPAARFASEFCDQRRPSKTEGAGNAGCTPHPLPCVQNKKDARRPTQVRRNHSGTPCAMALRLTPRSPRCTGLFSHRRAMRITSTRLDPQHRGIRTTRLDRTHRAARLAARRVHRNPPHVW